MSRGGVIGGPADGGVADGGPADGGVSDGDVAGIGRDRVAVPPADGPAHDSPAHRGLRVRDVPLLDAGGRPAGSLSVVVPSGALVAVSSRSAVLSDALAGVAGQLPLRGGSVELDGRAVELDCPADRIGYVGADHALVGTLTAVENVVVALLGRDAARGRSRDDRRTGTAERWRRAQDQLASLGLAEDSRHHLVEQLSGGQHQRTALARALAPRPRALVLEEPTSELDPVSAEQVVAALRVATAAGACVLVATTDPVVLDVADRHVVV